MLKIKKGMLLHQIKNQSFVVPVGNMLNEFKGMIRLNQTGVFYWKELEKGITREELLVKAKDTFEGVDETILASDLDAFLADIDFALEHAE